MKKLFPKALLYKEWKNARWGLLGLTLFLLLSGPFEATRMLSNLKEAADRNGAVLTHSIYWFQSLLYGNRGFFLWLFVFAIGMTLWLFYEDRQEATVSFITSLPFTKEQMYRVKWLLGAGVITGAFLINGLILSVFYFSNGGWMFSTPYQVIPSWTVLYWLFTLAAFSFLLFVQGVMGHPVAAAVVGPIASLVPWFVLVGLQDIIRYQFQLNYNHPLVSWLGSTSELFIWPYLVSPDYRQGLNNIHYPIYDNLSGRFLILALIIIACTLLGHWVFRKNAVEKSGQLLVFPSLEPVLIYGFALCLGILLTLLFGLGYDPSSALRANILLLVGLVGGWFFARRVVGYYRH